MPYTITTTFFGHAPIVDEFPDLDSAAESWVDTAEAYIFDWQGLSSDVRAIVLRNPAGLVLNRRGFS